MSRRRPSEDVGRRNAANGLHSMCVVAPMPQRAPARMIVLFPDAVHIGCIGGRPCEAFNSFSSCWTGRACIAPASSATPRPVRVGSSRLAVCNPPRSPALEFARPEAPRVSAPFAERRRPRLAPLPAQEHLLPNMWRRPTSAIIIGGGVAGTSIAKALAERGVKKVTVLEKAGQLCAGATWHAAGLVTRFGGSPKIKKVHVHALEMMCRLHEEEAGVGLHLTGSIRLIEKGDKDRLLEAKQNVAMAKLE